MKIATSATGPDSDHAAPGRRRVLARGRRLR